MKKRHILAVGGIALLVILGSYIYVHRDGLILASAMTQNQSRPDFMDDVRWSDESSDALIKKRFPVGSAEADLIDVLRTSRFVISPAEKTAELRLKNLPCNERLEVRWSVDTQGKLLTVEGAAIEAGCL